jgi:hypothetical protein
MTWLFHLLLMDFGRMVTSRMFYRCYLYTTNDNDILFYTKILLSFVISQSIYAHRLTDLFILYGIFLSSAAFGAFIY